MNVYPSGATANWSHSAAHPRWQSTPTGHRKSYNNANKRTLSSICQRFALFQYHRQAPIDLN
jgi:hypothetical protein